MTIDFEVPKSEIYGYHRETQRSTGIDESTALNFYHDGEKNLAATAGNLLTIYRVNSRGGQDANDRLEYCDEFELWGNIVTVARVRFAGSLRDSLLLSFEEAKCSIVEYEPETGGLTTISMHHFQEDQLRRGFRKMCSMPIARVDSYQRCAGLLVYGAYLAILPFRRTQNQQTGQKHQAVSSFMIDIQDLPVKIASVLDFQFLDGYNDPTIVILYEALPTWTGRVTDRQDTCGIVSLSVNLLDQTHPVIWQMSSLPFDSSSIVPVPKPLGGLLVFATNSMIYLDQSVPPYGVALNSLTSGSTQFALKSQDVSPLNLLNSKACFLSEDTLCLSVETGDVYILTLKKDSLNNVRRFHLEQAASSVVPTTLTKLSGSLIFLGSRLGNSLLLRYHTELHSGRGIHKATDEPGEDDTNGLVPEEGLDPKWVDDVKKESESDSPQSKRKRLSNPASEWDNAPQGNGLIPKRNKSLFEVEEDELGTVEGYYGDEIFELDTNMYYEFSTMDNLSNIGPCGPVELIHTANPNEAYDQLGNDARDRNIDICVLSGKDKTGSVTVLQKSVRPNIVSQFPFPTNYNDMWTLKRKTENQHSLLVMTKKDQTMVFKTGSILEELKKEDCGLATNAKTIFCSTLGDGRYIVQVLPRAVVLVDHETQETLQNMPFDLNGQIIQGVACDPYLVILASKGAIISLVLYKNADGNIMLKTSTAPPSNHDIPEKRITNISMMKDDDAVFVLGKGKPEHKIIQEPKKILSTKEKISVPSISQLVDPLRAKFDSMNNILTAEEEDELLYGDMEMATVDSVFTKDDVETKDGDVYVDNSGAGRQWLILTRAGGNLEMYTMPDCTLRFKDRNFANAPRVLETGRFEGAEGRRVDVMDVQEMNLFKIGPSGIPHLVVIIGDQMMIYRFRSTPIRFQTEHPVLSGRFIKLQNKTRLVRPIPGVGDDHTKTKHRNNKLIRRFRNIAGYDGFFLGGPYPFWVFSGVTGKLSIHSMWQEGHVNAFTEFDNEKCASGFLFFRHSNKTLTVAALQPFLKYDADWPFKKVKLNYTPHFSSYDLEQKVLTICGSRNEKIEMLPKINAEGHKEYEDLPEVTRVETQLFPQYFVEMFSPATWEVIPNSRIEMDAHEHILCLKSVYLKSEASMTGRKQYIALGTSNICGEDYQSRGRMILLEVTDVVPEPGKPLTRFKYKTVYDEPQRGPVTAVDSLDGSLVAAIGQKVFIHMFMENDLRATGFVDTQLYTHSTICFKNYALVGDIQQGIQLLRHQGERNCISSISRARKAGEVMSVGLLIDGNQVGLVSTDTHRNLHVYMYKPDVKESNGGKQLIRQADFNLGKRVMTIWNSIGRQNDTCSKVALTENDSRHVTFYAGLDGSIGDIVPLSEKVFRRLQLLQTLVQSHLPHYGGLNPKEYRYATNQYRDLENAAKNIIDGDLLERFTGLSFTEQADLSRKIGVTREALLDDMMDVTRTTNLF